MKNNPDCHNDRTRTTTTTCIASVSALFFDNVLKKLHVPVMRKNAMLYDKSLRNQASPRPNFMQRRQWANPRALILNIEGATDHYRLSK